MFDSSSVEEKNILEASETSRILEKILKSSKPVVVSGGGVTHSKAEKELYRFVKSLDIPVVDTMMGLGTYPQNDVNYFGMIGIFGDKAANQIIKEADLIISLGARFNDRVTCMFKEIDLSSKFIQIDINKSEISRVIRAADFICADTKVVLSLFNQLLESSQYEKFSGWLKTAEALKSLNIERKRQTNLMHSFEVIQK